jgi:glycosyltransferase involved in cell wall biosynthesis
MTLNIILNGQGPEPPTTMYVSGGTTRLIEIMKRFCKQKYVNLYVVSSEGVCNTFKRNNIRAKYFPIPYFLKNATSYNKLLLDSVLRTIFVCFYSLPVNDGILYSASDFIWDVLPAFAWKLRNKNIKWVQVVHHLYENPVRRRGKNFLVNILGFLSQRISFIMIKWKADLVIVVNPLVKQQLIVLGFNARKIKVNYNGVDLIKVKNIKPSNKKYDCAFLGRLNISKGVFDLVKIWKIIVNKNSSITLAIIGGGDETVKHALIDKVREETLENNIDILGFLSDEQAFGILKSCRVFVFPSYEEGFGIAALEAMACGLPVVAWNLPVYREVFPKGMIKVPIGDIKKFADEVLRLLNDPELHEKMRSEATEMASKYNWNEIAKKELEFIKRTVY